MKKKSPFEEFDERLEELGKLSFEERVERLKKNIEPGPNSLMEPSKRRGEENVKEFISGVITKFECWVTAAILNGYLATNPYMHDFPVGSLSFDEFRKAGTRLEKLGFAIEYSGNPPSTLYVALYGEKSEKKQGS